MSAEHKQIFFCASLQSKCVGKVLMQQLNFEACSGSYGGRLCLGVAAAVINDVSKINDYMLHTSST